MTTTLPVLAGTISTILFAASMLPMVLKALRTKDLRSYSFSNIILTNVANLVHSFYVYNLPAGPIWLLHTFYVVTGGLLLICYIRYMPRKRPSGRFGWLSHSNAWYTLWYTVYTVRCEFLLGRKRAGADSPAP